MNDCFSLIFTIALQTNVLQLILLLEVLTLLPVVFAALTYIDNHNNRK